MNSIYCDAALNSDPIDIDQYLPIKCDEEAIKFCDNADGLLSDRKKALVKRIYGACDLSNTVTFVSSLADVLFNINYQITHRWPAKQ